MGRTFLMTAYRAAGFAAVALLACGCASVIDGTTQVVAIDSSPVGGANCIVSNDRGTWPVTTPGAVTLLKSQSVLTVVCNKEGYAEARFYAAGRMSNSALIGTMLPYAGLVSAAVDGASGAATLYPGAVHLELKPALSAAAGAAASPPVSMPIHQKEGSSQ